MDDDGDFDGAAALDMYVKQAVKQAESIAITDTITAKQKKILYNKLKQNENNPDMKCSTDVTLLLRP